MKSHRECAPHPGGVHQAYRALPHTPLSPTNGHLPSDSVEVGESLQAARRNRPRRPLFRAAAAADRDARPARDPIESTRREYKWSASRIALELHQDATRSAFIDPDGETNREPQTIVAERPGHVVHVDVKKRGRIPDGGGWRVHGKNSPEAKAAARTKTRGAKEDRRCLPSLRNRRTLAAGLYRGAGH